MIAGALIFIGKCVLTLFCAGFALVPWALISIRRYQEEDRKRWGAIRAAEKATPPHCDLIWVNRHFGTRL